MKTGHAVLRMDVNDMMKRKRSNSYFNLKQCRVSTRMNVSNCQLMKRHFIGRSSWISMITLMCENIKHHCSISMLRVSCLVAIVSHVNSRATGAIETSGPFYKIIKYSY